jgi:hypothetical protein
VPTPLLLVHHQQLSCSYTITSDFNIFNICTIKQLQVDADSLFTWLYFIDGVMALVSQHTQSGASCVDKVSHASELIKGNMLSTSVM